MPKITPQRQYSILLFLKHETRKQDTQRTEPKHTPSWLKLYNGLPEVASIDSRYYLAYFSLELNFCRSVNASDNEFWSVSVLLATNFSGIGGPR